MDQKGKRLFIIAFIFLLIFLGIAGYILLDKNESNLSLSQNNPLLFPFGDRETLAGDLVAVESTNEPFNSSDIIILGDPEYNNITNRLRKITNFPVSGFHSIITSTTNNEGIFTKEHSIRYNDQRSGHFFEGIITYDNILNRKITNSNLPSAEDLTFNSNGNVGIIRYEENNNIRSFLINFPEKLKTPSYCLQDFLPAKIGDKNTNIINLQNFLSERISIPVTIDGSFGKKTTEYIKKYQEDNNLSVDGIINNETLLFINKTCENLRNYYQEIRNLPQEINGLPITDYYQQLVKNPSGTKFFSIIKNTETGEVQGVLEDFINRKRELIFSSPFSEWLPQFISDSIITLTTYASGTVEGYMYQLNVQSNAFQKKLGPINGLTTNTNPSGTKTLISTWENNRLVNKIITLNNLETQTVSFTTIPEKCTWYNDDVLICGIPTTIPNGIYPDVWYKGISRFSDTLQKYTVSTDQLETLAIFPESVDVIRIESDKAAEYVFFMNKNTYELWSYRIGGND